MLRWSAAAVALLLSLPASAAECADATGTSRCIDANAFWARPSSERWLAIPSASSPPLGRIGFGVVVDSAIRPLVLEVPSPSPEGREVRLVDYAIDANTVLAAGLGRGVELGFVLVTVLHQQGAGSAGITSQSGQPLARTTERDPRVSVAFATELGAALALKPRLELSLPFGDDRAYASDGAFVVAPGATLEWQLGRFALGANLGLRLRPAVSMGNARWGSQAEIGVGALFEILEERRLSVALEAFALPSLVDATSDRGRALGIELGLIPAEWLASSVLRLDSARSFWLALGAGGGLPLSFEESAAGRRWLRGPTSPELRAVLSVRYAPR